MCPQHNYNARGEWGVVSVNDIHNIEQNCRRIGASVFINTRESILHLSLRSLFVWCSYMIIEVSISTFKTWSYWRMQLISLEQHSKVSWIVYTLRTVNPIHGLHKELLFVCLAANQVTDKELRPLPTHAQSKSPFLLWTSWEECHWKGLL